MRHRLFHFCFAMFIIASCGDEDLPEKNKQIPPAAPNTPSDLELTAKMFEPDRVIMVNIEMDPEDWDALRTQTRSILDVVGASCLEEPPVRPFTYFSATVIIDDVKLKNVGVRKKGFFGSLDTERPSLKIKFSEFIPGQRFSGLKRMTLNNNKSDPSQIKQCLGYDLFRQVGIPAPRCNFAKVTINGANLGVYSHVESIKKQFLEQHFSDNQGNLYEGALSDFRPGWVDTFQRKTNKDNADRSDIKAIVGAFESDDQHLLDSLTMFFDMDSFITFWVMELLIGHADGYARNTNNFYLYHDPETDLFFFIPWGIDSTFFSFTSPLPWESKPAPSSVWAEGVLSRRLYRLPESQTQYIAKIEELLDAIWIENNIINEADRMARLISAHVDASKQTEFRDSIQAVQDYVLERRSELEAGLNTLPSWDWPLRDPWCIDKIGSIGASFSTTWGTAGADAFASGSGTLDIDITQDPVGSPVAVGATSGIDPKTGEYIIQIVGWYDPNVAIIVHLVINQDLLVPQSSIPLDWIVASGNVIHIQFIQDADPIFSILGMIGDGILELGQASVVSGEPVIGTLSAIVYEPLF